MFYQLIRCLLSPIFSMLIFLGGKKGEFLKKRLEQSYENLKNEPYIWVHCSSVGEINLAETFIKKLLLSQQKRVLLSMFTDTGIKVARDKFLNNEMVDIIYFPLDSKKNIDKILNKIKLELLVLVETEIWPNLINEASKISKVIMINGRISDRSFRRYKKISFFLKKIFVKIDFFFMQSDEDSKRIISLGAERKKVETLGNLKFDISFKEYDEVEKSYLKDILSVENRKIFVAGSTRSGEYEILLDTYKALENTLLILVPRHIEKTPFVEEIIKKYGYTYKKYSELEKNKSVTDIVIVDKIGELRKLYSISDFAFVGGTLVDIGGHSLLEPLFYGKTPIFGKYLQNVREISGEILDLDLGYKVENVTDFLQAIEKIEKNQQGSQDKIRKLFEKNSKVADKIIEKIEKLI